MYPRASFPSSLRVVPRHWNWKCSFYPQMSQSLDSPFENQLVTICLLSITPPLVLIPQMHSKVANRVSSLTPDKSLLQPQNKVQLFNLHSRPPVVPRPPVVSIAVSWKPCLQQYFAMSPDRRTLLLVPQSICSAVWIHHWPMAPRTVSTHSLLHLRHLITHGTQQAFNACELQETLKATTR